MNTTKPTWDVPSLRASIAEAIKAAQAEKQRDPRDSGTCNMDFVYIPANGMRNAVGMQISGHCPSNMGVRGRILRIYSGDGNAGLNTRMCEAFMEKFNETGNTAYIYYQMD
jgi:hypothetical protein